MRLFIAVPLPVEFQKEVLLFQEKLKSGLGRSVRWTPPESIHITLKFLGETDVAQLPIISDECKKAMNSISPFLLSTSVPGCFPHIHTPRVLWLGLKENPDLSRIQSRLEGNLLNNGIPKEVRKFSPHLTLGRFKNPLNPDEKDFLIAMLEGKSEVSNLSFMVDMIQLIKSDLTKNGPIYSVIQSFKFCNPDE